MTAMNDFIQPRIHIEDRIATPTREAWDARQAQAAFREKCASAFQGR